MRALASLLVVLGMVGGFAGAEAPRGFPILRWLTREGYLEKAELERVIAMRAEVEACAADGGACVEKRIAKLEAQVALFEKARPKVPEEKKLLRVKIERSLKELRGRLEKRRAERAPPSRSSSP